MKKLLLASLSFVVFTFNGADPVQLAAVIAFTAGVYATRLLENRERAASASARSVADLKTPDAAAPVQRRVTAYSFQKKPFQSTEIPCAAKHHSG
jgi:hypothetical protein